MDYCPEIAIFHSAFQLVHKQAAGCLSSLSKETSGKYMKIIKTAVEEVCRGLEQDRDETESEAWSQKLHLMCLYSVIENSYRAPISLTPLLQKKQPGRVPVCSSLEMVSGVLPKFSSCFYFEVLKTCSWTHLFVECLEYIDRSTASTVLQDCLDHSKSEPIDQRDSELITMVTEKILSNCFAIPTQENAFVADLLKPLITERRYVHIMYLDNTEEQMTKKDQLKHIKDIRNDTKTEDLMDDTDDKVRFWDCFVNKYPDVMIDILDNFDRSLDMTESQGIQRMETCVPNVIYGIAKIILYWYIHVYASDSYTDSSYNSWFTNNFFLINKDGSTCTLTGKEANCYYLNIDTFEKVRDAKNRERLLDIINRAIDVLHEQQIKEDKEEQFFLPEDICVLRTEQHSLYGKTSVFLRMVRETLRSRCAENTTSFQKLTDLLSSVEAPSDTTSFIFGDDWLRDVTLEALLWRIEHRLNLLEECLKKLLSDRCWSFWKSDRAMTTFDGPEKKIKPVENIVRKGENADEQHFLLLSQCFVPFRTEIASFETHEIVVCLCVQFGQGVYEVMEQLTNMLNKKNHILQCINITIFLLKEEAWQAIPKMRQVLCSTFSKLSTSDKDLVVGSTYLDESLDMPWILGVDRSVSLCSMVTNTFNKVTSELDDKILNEIFLHCLVDPVAVFKGALEMCVKNEDQAVNFANILCHMPVTCKTQHKGEESGSSLMLKVVEEFLMEKTLTPKEEKHFVVFLKILMKETNKEHPSVILHPTDFISEYLLDGVNVENFLSSDYYPIKCGFALSLIVAALECGSNTNSDWPNCKFEPAVLIVNLAGILHECTEIWEEANGNSGVVSYQEDSEPSVTIVTGYQKLAMREGVNLCLEMLTEMVLAGHMVMPDNQSVYWLLAVTEDLNCLVKVQIAMLLFKLGYVQPMTSWRLTFQQMTSTLADNLPSVLLMSTVSTELKEELCRSDMINIEIFYDDLIAALIQVLPNMLISEVQQVVSILEMFVSEGVVSICYRSSSQTPVPLTDLTSIQATLCSSQVLSDVILTFAVIQGKRHAMLRHVLQCYVTVLKAKCSQDYNTTELFLFTMSQLFYHMCVVVETLPQDCVDNGLVLLLHLLTKFKDTSSLKNKQKDGVKRRTRPKENDGEKLNSKMVKNLENSMLSSINALPDIFEEKHMLLKKLNE